MNKTRIEWAQSTWNPVTGCLHKCPYCYARRIANRFGGCDAGSTFWKYHQATWRRLNPDSPIEEALFEVDAKCPPINIRFDTEKQVQKTSVAPYPFNFQPTLHRYRLADYEKKSGRTIFVCSMADLFGEWVPDEWIEEVFAACERAPQHRYLFLTKNPARFCELANKGKLPEGDNYWYGSTVTQAGAQFFGGGVRYNTFLSIEPLRAPLNAGIGSFGGARLLIIGAETGRRKDKIIPQKEWIDNICEAASLTHAAVFMKNSLLPIMGEENMRRELPWSESTREKED